MSDTPRTDAVVFGIVRPVQGKNCSRHEVVPADFARQLERELEGTAEMFNAMRRTAEEAQDRVRTLTQQRDEARAGTWQGIETAPKDGTEILVLDRGVVIHVQWGGNFGSVLI